MENEELAAEVIRELREFGVKVSLDDFGTGYSALSYLTHYKVDAIKIDRSFIKEIGVNEQNELVTKGIIRLVQSLKIDVIAEGVETPEQLRFLRKLKCRYVQGYLFSKPVPAQEFTELLMKGRIEVGAQLSRQENESADRRQHYRAHFSPPLLGEMTILKFMGREIRLGKTEVHIEDIGLDGISFTSTVKLAVRPDMVLGVETVIMGQPVRFVGSLVWHEERDSDLHHYGMKFEQDAELQDILAQVLDPLANSRGEHA